MIPLRHLLVLDIPRDGAGTRRARSRVSGRRIATSTDRMIDFRMVFRWARRYFRAPVCFVLVGVVCVVFPFQRLSGLWWRDVDHLRRALAYSAAETARGQWWRLLTVNVVHDPVAPDFLSPGFSHLLNNLVTFL